MRPRDLPGRLERYTDRSGECWVWTKGLTLDGYGRMSLDGRDCCAHRVSYEHHVGPIPEGLTLDHLCRNRACINPAHLEPVTIAENSRRGENVSHVTARVGICQRGHEVTEGRCLVCRSVAQRAWYERTLAARGKAPRSAPRPRAAYAASSLLGAK